MFYYKIQEQVENKMRDDNCIFCKLANGVFPTNSIYEDDEFNDGPDWKAVHLATLKYLANRGAVDMVKLSNKIETITELAGIYASLDQIRLVYYLDY